jgi:hypothetical protein
LGSERTLPSGGFTARVRRNTVSKLVTYLRKQPGEEWDDYIFMMIIYIGLAGEAILLFAHLLTQLVAMLLSL